MKFKVLAVLLLITAGCLTSYGQDRRWTVNVGGGYSPLFGDLNNYLNNGWHITAGGGYNFGPFFSTTIDYTYHRFGVSPLVLHDNRASGGSAHVWSFTANPKLRLSAVGRVRPFVVGGVGYYRRYVELTNAISRPLSLAPSLSGPGGSLGLGFDISLGDSRFALFTDARYLYAATGGFPVRMVPLTAGLRW